MSAFSMELYVKDVLLLLAFGSNVRNLTHWDDELTHSNHDLENDDVFPRRILLADIDTDSTEILKILLTLEGLAVETAFSGRDVMELAERFNPQVVLLNVGFPELETERMVQDLRRALPEVKLVALLDWRLGKEDLLRWKDLGFDHHLIKPVEAKDVIALIKK